jgi:RNA polymerase sigma-70 factor, ECF subfamily
MSEQPVANTLPTAAPAHADRLSSLFEAHSDRLYRLARRLAPSADDALDLVQETFLKAARSPNAIPCGPSDEEAWLVRVVINIRRDQWRREAVRRRFDLSPPTVIAADQERQLLARTIVWRGLDALSPRRRAAVIMYELEGLTVPAIASLLGVRAVTVRWHLSRGRRELTRQIRLISGGSDEQFENSPGGRRPGPARSPAR